jgi:hypothetical protein
MKITTTFLFQNRRRKKKKKKEEEKERRENDVAGGIRENRRERGGCTNNRVDRGGEGDDDKAQREGGEKPPPPPHSLGCVCVVLKEEWEKVFPSVPLPIRGSPAVSRTADSSSFGIFVCTPPLLRRVAFCVREEKRGEIQGGLRPAAGSSLSADARK